MAQATDGITFKGVKFETSTNGSLWADASGEMTTLELEGGERATEDTHTADGDTPIVSTGKRDSIGITATTLYREAAGSGYALAKAAYEGDSLLYFRWSPKGGGTGVKQFVASGKVTSPPYPVGEVGSAGLVLTKITIRAKEVTESTVA